MVTRVFRDHSEANMNSLCNDVNDMCSSYFEYVLGKKRMKSAGGF